MILIGGGLTNRKTKSNGKLKAHNKYHVGRRINMN